MSFLNRQAPLGGGAAATAVIERPGAETSETAVLDEAHLGDITGAFGTIGQRDVAPRTTWWRRLRTLLVILGPGLVVMIGDNDAGGVATYTQAGQQYGAHLLWTLLVLAPVLYLNQEMVVRLGAVSGVGHARLIFERFGRLWGAFSVGDLFILNTLTVVTEFIGVNLALGYFGVSKYVGVPISVLLLVAMAVTGRFARWERAMMVLIIPLNAVMIPLFFLSHPHAGPIATGTFVPNFPGGLNSTLLLLITAIVGTTVAPWQLFFQQSNVVDKRITPRWVPYERTDTLIGVVLVILGAAALMCVTAFGLAHTPLVGNFVDPGASAAGLRHLGNGAAGFLLAVALLDLSLIGASAVTLSSTYTFGDVFRRRHSLHWAPTQAPGFYALYGATLALSAAIVLIPGAPLGTITVGVQALAGVLLPSASVFLLLLCNDRDVLGPWVNTTRRNVFTATVIWVLVLLSLALTASTMFSDLSAATLQAGLVIGAGVGLIGGVGLFVAKRIGARRRPEALGERAPTWAQPGLSRSQRRGLRRAAQGSYRMPPLATLSRPRFSRQRWVGMVVLRGYLAIAFALAMVKIVQVAAG